MEASDDMVGKEVIVKGWCRTVRDQKAFSFIEVNDGSLPKGIQVVGSVCSPPLHAAGLLLLRGCAGCALVGDTQDRVKHACSLTAPCA